MNNKQQIEKIFNRYTRAEFTQLYTYALAHETLTGLAESLDVSVHILRNIAKTYLGIILPAGRPTKFAPLVGC